MRWVLLGAVAIVGALGFAGRALVVTGLPVEGPALLAACALGGFAGAAALRRHAAVTNLQVALASVLALLGGMLASVVAGVESVGESGALLVGGAVLAAVAGAMAGRRLAAPMASRVPSALAVLMLAAFVTHGLMLAAVVLVVESSELVTVMVILPAAFAGGLVTQAASPVRRVWASGSGAMMMFLLMVDLTPPLAELVSLLVGFAFFACIGALGARVAIARWPRPRPREIATIPDASIIAR